MIKRWKKEFHQAGVVLRDPEEGESIEGSTVGRAKMVTTKVGLEGDRDPPPPMEMGIIGSGVDMKSTLDVVPQYVESIGSALRYKISLSLMV